MLRGVDRLGGDLEVGAALGELDWDFPTYIALTLGVASCAQCMCICMVALALQAGEGLHRASSATNQLSSNTPTG